MKNIELFIKDKVIYNYNIKKEENYINIGYGINNKYAQYMASSIVSFCINNSNINFIFHIIGLNLSNDTKIKIQKIAEKYLISIIIYDVDSSYMEKLPTKEHLPLPTYFRFILPKVLSKVDKLFYIDSDILCLKKANELFEIDLKDNIIAAVPDVKYMNDKCNSYLNLNNHIYFNAGMLVINVKKWNENKISELAMKSLIEQPETFKHLDQDVLNLLLTGKVKYLSAKYNCFVNYSNVKKDINMKEEEILLLHFVGYPKPWSIAWPISNFYNKFNANLYNYYENKTPWKNSALELPKNYIEMKAYVKGLLNSGQYIKAIKWGLKAIAHRMNL